MKIKNQNLLCKFTERILLKNMNLSYYIFIINDFIPVKYYHSRDRDQNVGFRLLTIVNRV
jgi:hypothetical protein